MTSTGTASNSAIFMYRLPNTTEVEHISGELSDTCDVEDAILIQPFSGKKLFLIPIKEQSEVTEPVEVLGSKEKEYDSEKTGGSTGSTAVSLQDMAIERSRDEIKGIHIDTKASYLARFESFHSSLKKGDHEKLILSRVEEKETAKSPEELFEALNAKYTNTFNYLLMSAEHGVWLGATPERLGVVEGNTLHTEAIAGTKPVNVPRTWTEKERIEHQLVIDFIAENLEKNGCKVKVEETKELTAGMVKHLHTKLQADIAGALGSDLIDGLHPTSATCGIPQKSAQDFIIENEEHHRELYTGYIGIITPEKQQYFVNLRCMQVQGDKAYLYLGGGLTVDSEGELEWNETCEKAKTLLGVL
ncbi:MAG: chorismate-binding protein [Crocinitomicaceae bacterium]|nr:chorismate-binding protein [Crocinitomicaceae bacterium]